jgi:sortase A
MTASAHGRRRGRNRPDGLGPVGFRFDRLRSGHSSKQGFRPRLSHAFYGDAPKRPLSLSELASVWTLLAISALTAWFVLYAMLLSGFQQNRNNSVLYSQLREGLSGATTPIGGIIAPGTPIALLESANGGIGKLVVVEGTSPSDLRNGPGHLRDTPLPGQVGVSVLYGRSLTYGGPFGHVTGFRAGQTIGVTTGQGQFTYVVDRVRRAGDPLPTPLATGGSRLLLETTSGRGLSATSLVYVDATLKGSAVQAPSGRLAATPTNERAMAVDHTGLIKLVLWLQALLLLGVLIVWARARWGLAQAWMVGLPSLIAVLWGTTGNVMMMLPNLV